MKISDLNQGDVIVVERIDAEDWLIQQVMVISVRGYPRPTVVDKTGAIYELTSPLLPRITKIVFVEMELGQSIDLPDRPQSLS